MNAEPAFQFTKQQRAVINHAGGALLVAAGPGTGKTRVIVERIAYLVEHELALPNEILALTFGRGAANEMMHRIALRLGERGGPITFSTFHSFSLRLIHQHHTNLGYPTPPRVITTRDQVELVRRVIATTNNPILDPIGRISTRHFGPRIIAGELAKLYERSDNVQDPDIRTAFETIATEYRTIRRKASLIDHPAMVPEAVELLEDEAGLAADLQQRFRYVIVDEYQDTGTTQERLLDFLAPSPAPLMVVGDDDQSIYAFRGSTPQNLQAFAERQDTARIDLNENWRCGSSIQNAASALIALNTDRLDKTVRAHASTGGGSIEWLSFDGLQVHARAIAQMIDDEIRINRRFCRDIAVLWRTLSHPLAELLLDQLLHLGIPARMARDHPFSVGLPAAFAALIQLRKSGPMHINDSLIGTILESILSGVNPIFGQRAQREARRTNQSLKEAISHLASTDTVYQPLSETVKAIDRISQSSADEVSTFLYEAWLEFPSLRKAARSLLSEDIGIATQARRTVGAFNALIADAEAFVLANPAADLSMWNERLVQDFPVADEHSEISSLQDDVVLLMTVHQAKGLEWPVVFVPAMEEGFFPTTRLDHGVIVRGSPSTAGQDRATIEEERRLFYVAITRAKERAVVSHSGEGQYGSASPSRFLTELGIQPLPAAPTTHPRTRAEVEVVMRQRLRHGTPIERGAATHALARLPQDERHRWWTSNPSIHKPPPIATNDALKISVTGLTDFRACPYRFRCQHVLGLRGQSDAARGMGTIVHAALRDFHAPDATHTFESGTLKRLLDTHWDDTQFPFTSIAKRFKKDAREFTTLYVHHHGARGKAIAVEQSFKFDLAGLRIRGRIDAIFEHEGSTEIVDFKTGRVVTKRTAADDLQLGLYGLAFDHAETLAALAPPQRAVYLYLTNLGPRADGTRQRSTAREDRDLVATKVVGYASTIRSGNFPTKGELLSDKTRIPPGDEAVVRDRSICKYCDFKRLCPDYRNGLT